MTSDVAQYLNERKSQPNRIWSLNGPVKMANSATYEALVAELGGVSGRVVLGLTAWALMATAVGNECPNCGTVPGHST